MQGGRLEGLPLYYQQGYPYRNYNDFSYEEEKRDEPLPQAGGNIFQMVPVMFVTALIVTVYCIFVVYHCSPMLDMPHKFTEGMSTLAAFQVITCMLILCFVRSITTPPGEIPDSDEWYIQDFAPKSQEGSRRFEEVKSSGERRHCKWCRKHKPDRCHHCRICKRCVLKMDHHCPWIYNCVGWRNHKSFFLLLFYTLLATHLVTWTMLPTLITTLQGDAPFVTMFVILFGQSLCGFMMCLVTGFFGFHIWLVMGSMTTIEYCEKSAMKGVSSAPKTSLYDQGCYENLCEVLGRNPLLWLWPTLPAEGDGIEFVRETTRLSVDLESSRAIRKRAAASRPARSTERVSRRKEFLATAAMSGVM